MDRTSSESRPDKPLVEDCLRLDLAWLMRLGPLREGRAGDGAVEWSIYGQIVASASFRFDLRCVETARIIICLNHAVEAGARMPVQQVVLLAATRQHFGGHRWWMRCPIAGKRARVLYLPPGGDRFAGRSALGLGYRVERISHFDRPFEKLFRLQRKLGTPEHLGATPARPKGMWERTYERHLARLSSLDAACSDEICRLAGIEANISKGDPLAFPE